MAEPRSPALRAASKILDVLARRVPGEPTKVSRRDVRQQTGLSEEEFDAGETFLLQAQYMKGTFGGDIGSRWLTPAGLEYYEVLHRMVEPSLQIGAVFHGPVEGSNIQAVASAVQSSVQQVVEGTSKEALQAAIAKVVEDIVAAVRAELTVDELAAYAAAAKELKNEASSSTPNKTILARCLSTLAFLDGAEKVLKLGDRAIALAAKVAPYFPLIVGYLNSLR